MGLLEAHSSDVTVVQALYLLLKKGGAEGTELERVLLLLKVRAES